VFKRIFIPLNGTEIKNITFILKKRKMWYLYTIQTQRRWNLLICKAQTPKATCCLSYV
jgi:hypothetical protein